jgi:hypothetical protein
MIQIKEVMIAQDYVAEEILEQEAAIQAEAENLDMAAVNAEQFETEEFRKRQKQQKKPIRPISHPSHPASTHGGTAKEITGIEAIGSGTPLAPFVMLPEGYEGTLIGSYTNQTNQQIITGINYHISDALNHFSLAEQFLGHNDLFNWVLNQVNAESNIWAAIYEVYRITDPNMRSQTWNTLKQRLGQHRPFIQALP